MVDQISIRLANRSTFRTQRLVGQSLAIFSLGIGLLSMPAQARLHDRHLLHMHIVKEGHADISPGQAASIAENQYGGKVLKVTRQGDTYQVRLLLPSGTIKNVTVDANNGSIR